MRLTCYFRPASLDFMKQIFTLFIFIAWFSAPAQNSISDLYFETELEEQLFRDVAESDSKQIELLMAASGVKNRMEIEQARETLDKYVAQFKSSGILDKSPKKQIKSIHATIHDGMFDLYQYENRFSDVFRKREYNCVSATIVYGYVLTQLGIPFTFMEKPNHVYIVTFPKDESIILESTDPTNSGSYIVTPESKTDYVNQLLEAKLITMSMYPGLTKDQIYDQIASGQNMPISFRQIVGVQYANYAFYASKEEKLELAIQNLEKALWLFADPDWKKTLSVLRAQFIEQSLANPNTEQIIQLARFANDTANADESEAIAGAYFRIMRKVMVDDKDVVKANQLSQVLFKNLRDSAMLAEMKAPFYTEMARWNILDEQVEQGELYLDSLYAVAGFSDDFQALMMSLLAYYGENNSSQEFLSKFERTEKKFPEIVSDPLFLAAKCELYLMLSYQNFAMRKRSIGMSYIAEFEKIAPTARLSLIEKGFVAQAYGEAIGYQFELGNFNKAKALVNKALEFAPYSTELLTRREMLSRY